MMFKKNKLDNYFFVADEHYQHNNIIKYCNRPFQNVEEMDEELIKRHNEVVAPEDTTIHAGDFAWTTSKTEAYSIAKRLNGEHIFLRGSHDVWMRQGGFYHEIWEKKIGDNYVVVCHYAMRSWPRSHYNSIQLFGHTHGRLEGLGKSIDIGVDTNNFYPYSMDDIKRIMKTRPDNPNLVKKSIGK